MLDFSYERCAALERCQQTADSSELNAWLECFLLHYRNLVEFFGSEKSRKDGTDLHICRPTLWAKSSLSGEEAEKLKRKDLYKKYWQTISVYLAHCTTHRADEHADWKIHEMYGELKETLKQFETIMPLGRKKPGEIAGICARAVEGQYTTSTATVTIANLFPNKPQGH